MRRFISRKVVRVPRYKVILIKIIILIGLGFLVNISVNIFLKNINRNKFLNIVSYNAFGNIFNNYNFKKNYLYNNSYGFDIDSKKVSSDNTNITDLVIETSPIVYIYNTFQTDKYTNNYYNSYNINPVITQASLILQEYLKKEDISSIVEDQSVVKILKDNNIDYSLSYRGSRILLEEAKKKNNSLKYYIDLQMLDSDYNNSTYISDDGNYAKVLFVVGTLNSNYGNNEALMRALDNNLKELMEGISLGVSLQGGAGYHGVYNQDFDSNVILIRVGGAKNTIAEVNRTLKVLAKAIGKYIKEN